MTAIDPLRSIEIAGDKLFEAKLLALTCPHCGDDSVSLMAKFRSSYWQPFQCPACDGLSVPDAGNFLAFAALAVAPLLALGAVVWALPVVDWIGTLPIWSIALAIITVELGYFVGVVWMFRVY